MKTKVAAHLGELLVRYPALLPLRADIEAAFVLLLQTVTGGGKLLLCGNGGSAADADHWSGELLKGFQNRRPLSVEELDSLAPHLGDKLQSAIPAIPLTSFPALATAFGNDVDPDYVFAQLVWGLGHPGDVLIAISTSGNARNVCHAAQTARAKRMSVLGLTGETGGSLHNLCDICVRAPSLVTAHVQELHLPIYHSLSLMLEEELFGVD